MIVPLASLDQAALLALNNEHAVELSWLDENLLAALLAQSWHARGVAPMQAALIALDQRSTYAGRHFAWFRQRYERFVYVDRVVVASAARGLGLARMLYTDLFEAARAAGHDRVTCEVNATPPNPASDAFHAALGFVVIGEGPGEGSKTVRYMSRTFGAAGEELVPSGS